MFHLAIRFCEPYWLSTEKAAFHKKLAGAKLPLSGIPAALNCEHYDRRTSRQDYRAFRREPPEHRHQLQPCVVHLPSAAGYKHMDLCNGCMRGWGVPPWLADRNKTELTLPVKVLEACLLALR